jgi:serine/threonine protein phosphatase PrpC
LRPEDEFAILATDGIWDIMSPQEAVDLVRTSIFGADAGGAEGSDANETPPDLQGAADELIRKAAPYSEDNMTVLIICLNQQRGKGMTASSSSYGMVL